MALGNGHMHATHEHAIGPLHCAAADAERCEVDWMLVRRFLLFTKTNSSDGEFDLAVEANSIRSSTSHSKLPDEDV